MPGSLRENLELVNRVCSEVAAEFAPAMLAKIKARVRAESDGRIRACKPRRPDCYAARSGPKVTNFPQVDDSVIQLCYVLPLFNFEFDHLPAETPARE